VFVREIRAIGSTVFTAEELKTVTASYVNRYVTSEDLEALRVALTRLYVDRGYVNSGAVLPDQSVANGVITYQIVEGKLSAIDIEGNRWLRQDYYRDRLSRAAGPPLNVLKLQERLQILLEDPLIERVNAEIRPDTRPGEARLDIRVEEQSPLRAYLSYDNYQAPSVGAQRAVATVEHLSLTGRGDLAFLSYGRSEGLDPLIEAAYYLPVTASDTTLGLRYRQNDLTVVQEPFDALDVKSRSKVYALSLRQPVYRTPSMLFALELIGEYEKLNTSILGIPFDLEPGAEDGESSVTVVRFAQEFVHRTPSQVVAARSRFSLGIDALGSTVHSDGELPDSKFLSWLGQLQWVRQLSALQARPLRDTYLIVRSDLQISSDPLLTLEQIAVGGRYTVRGYPENSLVQDNAFIASAEARIPIVRNRRWAEYLEIVPFIDYGYGWNTDRDSASQSELSSVGIGMRWAITLRSRLTIRPQVELYWGHQLNDFNTPASAVEGDGFQFQVVIAAF
jgi:hemolysin activation/secretion protein